MLGTPRGGFKGFPGNTNSQGDALGWHRIGPLGLGLRVARSSSPVVEHVGLPVDTLTPALRAPADLMESLATTPSLGYVRTRLSNVKTP